MRRHGLLIAIALLLAGSAMADDTAIRPDVVYGHKDGLALTFDVLTPPNPNGAAVLWLQSGGWYSNYSPPQNKLEGSQPLLDAGITVLIVRHGSAPKYAVPDAVADVRRCVRFVHMTAEDLKVDPQRLGVLGGSAGGHLTLMLATTGDDGDPQAEDPVLRASSRINCGVSYYPPTDLRGWTTNPPAEIAKHDLLKPPLRFDAELEDDVSPLLQVTSDDAPVLMIHGDMDALVPIAHSQNIIPKFEEANVGSELITVVGAKHGYSEEQTKTIVVPAMVNWFKQHLSAN
ncbi:MAG: alpha/beta hydrolase [Planctomycetaceae bacterium]|nr:alpha/beta hydrolase [Planctomycetaceae bacterium]